MRCGNVILTGIRTTNCCFQLTLPPPDAFFFFFVSCCAGNIPDSDEVCLQTLDGDEVEGHQQSLLHSLPSEYVEVELLLHLLHGCCVYWQKEGRGLQSCESPGLWKHTALWGSSTQHVGGGPEGNVVSGLWVVWEISQTWQHGNPKYNGQRTPQWWSLGIPVKSMWTAVKMVADSKTWESTIMLHSETEDLCKDY